MSVKKFKVGDKVLVCKISDSRQSKGILNHTVTMIRFLHSICTIDSANDGYYYVKENNIRWLAEELELVEKTLENLEKGDLIKCASGDTKKILAVLDGVYLFSKTYDHEVADCWYTIYEMKKRGWEPVQPEEPAPETIEIGGKKYNKQEFEEAVKDLEPID